MNSKVTKMLLYLPTSVLGLACLFLQSRLMSYGYDDKGLLVAFRLEFVFLWGLTGLFFLLALVMLPWLGGQGTYEMNFPSCALSGGITAAAGAAMGFCALNGLVPGTMMLLSAGAAVAGVMMVIAGVCRFRGAKPPFWVDLAICVYYVAHLMASYRSWNANPHVERYAFPLLAGIAVMLFALHRARCAGGLMDRRRLVLSGFAGIFLCFPALAETGDPAFYLAAGLYCAGGMCELKRFPKTRRRPAFQPDPVREPEV